MALEADGAEFKAWVHSLSLGLSFSNYEMELMELATLLLQHWGIRQHSSHPFLDIVSVRGVPYWGSWCGIGRDSGCGIGSREAQCGSSLSLSSLVEYHKQVMQG